MPKLFVRQGHHQRAVDAAGIGDEHRSHFSNDLAQASERLLSGLAHQEAPAHCAESLIRLPSCRFAHSYQPKSGDGVLDTHLTPDRTSIGHPPGRRYGACSSRLMDNSGSVA